MVNVGKMASRDAPQFWNRIEDIGLETEAEMTNTDVKFMGAMGYDLVLYFLSFYVASASHIL